MFKLNTYLLASLLFVAGANSLSAQEVVKKADFDKPSTVSSDKIFGDGKEKVAVHEGNVTITQGTLEIKADRIKVSAALGKDKEVFEATGNPASYTQQLADGTMVVAKANNIRYDKATKTISLRGNAELYQNAFSIKTDSIIYDILKEQWQAQKNTDSQKQVVTVFDGAALKKTKEAIEKQKETTK
jgi:lipopolysaccharide export system protein LptA